jgi:hypothetical protein
MKSCKNLKGGLQEVSELLEVREQWVWSIGWLIINNVYGFSLGLPTKQNIPDKNFYQVKTCGFTN